MAIIQVNLRHNYLLYIVSQ